MAYSLTSGDQQKIKSLISDACKTKADIEALNEGIKDTTKDISKQLGIPVKVLNKLIRMVHKDSFADEQNEMNDIAELLIQAGYGSSVPTGNDSMIGHNSQQGDDRDSE